ncbi:HAD family phosphatase [Agromyces atrinae]|uniref:HAD superfamily hydrolase (TIGR01509 family) n=2 Tax=Agromyces atrinae TaxID=592376 RepID=A0A852S1E3_9MICO|nr:HAD family phosphatase [Agromyces atrinae]MCI2958639.1 HAD family phosphatase [Agromyces atrinae]NYD66142.1 HAD superfamily hydrolase (TIGR01509 family) [Agromyces atrinae]
MTTPLLPAAVLWDMDGTLVDTERYWIAAETALVESFGGRWTHEDALQLVGSGLWSSAEVLRGYGVDLPADEIVENLTESVRRQLVEQGVPWQPGAKELLEEIRSRGIRTALVTMSIRSMAEDIVGGIPFDAFELLVTGDSVDNPKPHPEPYLAAAAALGVAPEDCVAIEDSPPGVASAIAAGMTTIGVPHILDLDDTSATVIWPTLDGRTVDDIVAAFRSATDAEETA